MCVGVLVNRWTLSECYHLSLLPQVSRGNGPGNNTCHVSIVDRSQILHVLVVMATAADNGISFHTHPPHSTEEFDAYIVVSFTNATLVLSIGETVEEVTDSGFLGTTPTLACSRLGDDALIQVGGV